MSMRWLRMMLMTKRKKHPSYPKEQVVVEGCTLGFVEPTVTGNVYMSGGASEKDRVNGNGIYRGTPSFTIDAGAIANGCRLVTPYTGQFHPGAMKCKVDDQRPLRQNDMQAVSTPGVIGIFPGTFKATVKVVNANQDKVKMA